MEKYRVLIWGTGAGYTTLINLIKCYEYQGMFEVVGVTSKDTFYSYLSGYSFIAKEEIDWNSFDYIIVTNEKSFNEVLNELETLKKTTEKLIPGRVLRYPGFSLSSYEALRKNVPSIIAKDCWGGYVYHVLGLPFLSPTINLFFQDDEYLRFLSNIDFYSKLTVEYAGEGYSETGKFYYPLGKLGDVTIHFNHYKTFEEA